MKRILVVENEEAIRSICRLALSQEGFAVDTADNGALAQIMIGENQYDVCLIDLKMPVVGGQELFRWMEQKHPALTRRIIFISGDVMGKESADFLEQAAQPFLSKPFSLDELKAAVAKALESGDGR